jgi:DNA polymerase elongation subunit (family B)
VDILCDKKFEREDKINELIRTLRNNFPALEGDKVTFIGSTLMKYGDNDPYLNHCIVLNSCDKMPVKNSQIETYETEKEVLLAWTRLVQRENPDIIIGYNIFSFDYEFMFRRSQELYCVEDFLKLSRNINEISASVDYKNPSKIDIDRSSTTLASGTYELAIIKMNGRLQVDMLNWFRRTENLTSYKLDYVGGHFIGDEVKSLLHICRDETEVTRVQTNNMTGLQVESYIHFEEINHSSDYYKDGQKFKVIKVCKEEGWFEVLGNENPSAKKVKWGLAKDDVTPKDIFRMTNEGPASRAIIAKYCIQDCNLVHYLFNKVDVVTDLVEMAKLCSVPMSFLIFRGQGIKLTSYVAKKCREKGVLMPCINKGSKDDGYEGAIVLNPKCGLYLDDPVCVGDFASLYPSSMLSENLCPSSKVWTKIYDLAGNLVLETGEKDAEGNYIYDNLPEYEYVDVNFDTYRYIRKNPKAKAEKIKSGYKLCRYAQPLTIEGKEEKAIMPAILQELLKARKDTRKLIPQTQDEFMKNVLDKRQLAYKVTANSLYGQLGAKTSTFYEPDIAASTTATGRLLLTFAKKVVEECYADTNVDTKYGFVNTKAEYVYGDTDSVFFKFNLTDKETGEKILGEKALELSIEIAQEACHNVSKVLKQPHDFEYEKTFMPFCLLSKKRYVSIKYELDPKKGKRNEMGIVLKRRDNAPIVKDVYGGVIDILMKEKNIQKAIDYVNKCLQDLVDGNVPIEKLIITKSLRSFYKNPQGVAHKVLADRIGQRDPGNKPTSGDRIPFVYIITKESGKGKKILQGDKIETPSFIKENNFKIDYSFYITNQIMKPLLQLFGLVLEDIWLSQKPPRRAKVSNLKKEVENIKSSEEDEKKCEKKISKIKDKEVQALIFDKYLRDTNNVKAGNQNLNKFFTKTN